VGGLYADESSEQLFDRNLYGAEGEKSRRRAKEVEASMRVRIISYDPKVLIPN